MAKTKGGAAQDTAYQYLFEQISTGAWRPGERLPSENELSKELSVSRNTVRAAVSRLVGLGLVESRQGVGTFVCTRHLLESVRAIDTFLAMEKADRISVFEFRKAFESECAVLAAVRATTEDMAEMGDSIKKMEASTDKADIALHDMAFHRMLANSTKNTVFIQVFNIMHDTYAKVFEYNVALLGNRGAEHHRRILMALQTRDMEAARQSLLFHLEDTMRILSQQELQ